MLYKTYFLVCGKFSFGSGDSCGICNVSSAVDAMWSCLCATICIHQEIQCLPYAGFMLNNFPQTNKVKTMVPPKVKR